jgi:hypothetical protein
MGIAIGLKRVVGRVGDGWVIVGVGAGSEGGSWKLVKQRTGGLGSGSLTVWGTGSVLKVASSCGVLGSALGGVYRPVG